MTDPLDAQERHLHAMLRRMQEDHQQHIKPVLDQLVRIARLRPAPPMFVTAEQWAAVSEARAITDAEQGPSGRECSSPTPAKSTT